EAHIAAVQLDDFVDTTPAQIVHPGKLDRSAAEAVCQQCHLQAAAAIAAPGQNAWSFRPGDELRPHRSDFQRTDSAGNKVVGHVEQLHLSRCYTQTSTLTCVTCHDPHHQPRPEDQIDIYRDACLQCHQDVECGVDRMKRIATNDNDCSACHMPKIDTEISHAALHNHTIAVFDAKGEIVSTPPELPTDSLKDVLTVPDLPAEERDRRRAIATVKLSMMDPAFKATETELKSAYQYLMETYRQGQNADRDGRLKLAQLALSARQSDLALQVAESILTDDVPDDIEQAVALEILARLESGRGNVAIAEEYYNQLIRRRQNANDYYSLALCRLSSDDIDGCIELAEKALSLKPDLIPAHEMLAELLSTVRPQQATRHATVARQLNVARQQAQKRPK
ncbi:MAG: cytochrome c3 family protein, partial [Planctomycetota bacterium]